MTDMDSPLRRGFRAERDRAGERADQAARPKVSTKRLVTLSACITPAQLEEFKRRVAPQKPTPAITAMVLAFLDEKERNADDDE